MCFPRPPLVVSGEASAQSRRRYFVGRKVTFSRGHVLGDTFLGTRLPRPPRGRVERSAVTEGNEYSWGAQRSRDTPTDTADTTDTTGNAGSVEVSPRRAAGALRSRRRWFRRERKLRPTLLFSGRRRTATRDGLRPQTTDRGMTRFSAAYRSWSAARGPPPVVRRH